MSDIKAETDENLMVELTTGNKLAFDELYARYNRLLFSFFMKMLGRDQEKCEDFLQDLFVTLIEKPEYFDPSRRFKPWLYSIAHNMVKNEYKKMEVRKIMDRNADGDNVRINGNEPDKQTDDQLFAQKLNDALKLIDPDKREAFIMKYQQGFPIHDIAQIQGVKEGTIKSRLFYVKKYLCQELAEFKPNA